MKTSSNSLSNQIILAAALEGLEAQRSRLGNTIEQVRSALAHTAPSGPQLVAPKATLQAVPPPEKKPRRKMSRAARKRIAIAQKKRWQKYHEQHAA